MGWSAQYFTTIIIQGDTPQTGIFIYNGTPGLGTLIGAWAAAAGVDPYGNPYDAGINVNQGNITGVSISDSTATVLNILASTIANSTLTNNAISGGTITETTIIFDSGGGQLFGYTSTTTTITQTTPGTYNFTALTTTASVTVWGGAQGGNGGSTSEGGSGGNAGACAGEPAYHLVINNVYSYTVGQGGGPATTGAGNGGDGSDSFFDTAGPGVYAIAGTSAGPGSAGSNTIANAGGAGGVANGFGGGCSGGNSGNQTAAGNPGRVSTSNTHAGAPVGQTGSGTGGAGSDSGTSPASNGGTPGGGGGGAGQGSGTPLNLQKTYEAQFTASFYGPDATNGQANKVRSTSTMYQGGETASGGGANGNQRSVMVFNSNQIASDFAGYTATGAVLGLTNNHSWYDNGMLIDFDVPNSGGKVTSPPSTWPDDVNQNNTFAIGEGVGKSFQLGTAVAALFLANDINFLAIGGFVAADVPYDLSYYGYFTGGHGLAPHPTLTLSGTTNAAGSNTSGSGGNGQAIITYTTASAMEFALSPQSGSDANSNAFGAGYTGPVQAFTPGSSPTTVETWHNITLDTGWTAVSGQTPQYRILATGDIEMAGAATHAALTGTTNVNGSNPLPTAYRPASNHYLRTGNGGTVADSFYTTGGVIEALNQAGGGTVQVRLDGVCPLN
jgi:hypothetical protein